MESFFSRYRNLMVLILVLFAQVIALATQVKRPADPSKPAGASSRLIRIWAVEAVTPIENVFVSSGRWFRGLWHSYVDLRGVRRQNADLQAELDRMRLEAVRLREDAGQAQRLQALLGFKEQYIAKTLAAQVIGTSGSEQSRVIYIDKGSSDGIQRDMPVITPDGIIGKVLTPFPNSSQVLLISDPTSGVGAVLENSRLQGILKGSGGVITQLEYVMADEKVDVGERVVTSGGDGVFPKGLPIGSVTKVNPDIESDNFLSIKVKPAANLAKLDEVLIVTEVKQKEPDTSAEQPRRAADILARRLPTYKDKPPENAPKAGASPNTPGTATKPPATGTQAKPNSGAATKPKTTAPAGGEKPKPPASETTPQKPRPPENPR